MAVNVGYNLIKLKEKNVLSHIHKELSKIIFSIRPEFGIVIFNHV